MSVEPQVVKSHNIGRILKTVLVVWMTLFSIAVGVAIRDGRNNNAETKRLAENTRVLALQGKEAHDFACAFRIDLKKRADTTAETIKRTKEFLKTHPEGFAGFTKQDILTALDSQQRTLDGQRSTLLILNSVKCAKPKK